MTDPTIVDLNAMNRTDLNAYATAHGVEHPETYATKAELITAIDAAAAGPAPGADPQEQPLTDPAPENPDEVEMTTLVTEAPAPDSHSPNFAMSEEVAISGAKEAIDP